MRYCHKVWYINVCVLRNMYALEYLWTGNDAKAPEMSFQGLIPLRDNKEVNVRLGLALLNC